MPIKDKNFGNQKPYREYLMKFNREIANYTKALVQDKLPDVKVFDSFIHVAKEYERLCEITGRSFGVRLKLKKRSVKSRKLEICVKIVYIYAGAHLSSFQIGSAWALQRKGIPYIKIRDKYDYMIHCGNTWHLGRLVETHKAQLLMNFIVK